jgi:hypothetical protein
VLNVGGAALLGLRIDFDRSSLSRSTGLYLVDTQRTRSSFNLNTDCVQSR